MNTFGIKLFGILIAIVGGLFVFLSIKDVVLNGMNFFPTNFVICLVSAVFIFSGIGLVIQKGGVTKQEKKSPFTEMNKKSISSLVIAIVVLGIVWLGISSHENQCQEDFGVHSKGANRPRYTSCVCQAGYWLSATTQTCVPPILICEENNISAVGATVELKSNYDDYIQCRMSDNTTQEIYRSSAYPYYFR